MVRLRVFNGPETNWRLSRFDSDRPDVIPFSPRANGRSIAETPLSRAKALHENRHCRFCGHGTVDPVTLNDGLRDGSGRYVPGSATLVGFHCEHCHAEWPVYAAAE